jgi:antitoxin YefM
MDIINYSQIKNNLSQTMTTVCDNHQPVIVSHKNNRAVVIISLEDYQALQETAYLLSSPNNAKRLMESIAQLEAGQGIERELIE